MLSVTRRKYPTIPLAQADLNGQLPLRGRTFDVALCAPVGEHLTNLRVLFRELFASLTRRGRLVFSVFHPEMAAAGIEANFETGGTEYRLGALRHTVADYLDVESGWLICSRLDSAQSRKGLSCDARSSLRSSV